MKMKELLLKMYQIGVSGVNPGNLIKSSVRIDQIKSQIQICDQVFDSNLKFHVFGFGKAVYGMTRELQNILGKRISDGVISVPALVSDLPKIKTFVGGNNNLPDENSIAATNEILKSIAQIPNEDVIIIVISGGGSSLLCKPIPSLSLDDKLLTIRQLVQAGADIRELNTVRKCLSAVKGGRLAKKIGTHRAICLILSDIVGDPLDLIASGPTLANTDDPTAALEIIQKHKLELKIPRNVMQVIREPSSVSKIGENITNRIVGSNAIALKQILDGEASPNCRKILVSSCIEGLVNNIAKIYLDLSIEILRLLSTKNDTMFVGNMRRLLRGVSIFPNEQTLIYNLLEASKDPQMESIVLLMGGETTVKISGQGIGGRNQELAVLFSKALYDTLQTENNFPLWDVTFLSAGSDGIDGPTDAAGAFGCQQMILEANAQGLDVDQHLNFNDTHTFLSKVQNGKYLLKTGHTGTNVMDFHFLAFHKKQLK